MLSQRARVVLKVVTCLGYRANRQVRDHIGYPFPPNDTHRLNNQVYR